MNVDNDLTSALFLIGIICVSIWIAILIAIIEDK